MINVGAQSGYNVYQSPEGNVDHIIEAITINQYLVRFLMKMHELFPAPDGIKYCFMSADTDEGPALIFTAGVFNEDGTLNYFQNVLLEDSDFDFRPEELAINIYEDFFAGLDNFFRV